MTRSPLLWTLAVILTVGTLVYQRRTGPTYPMRGRVTLGGRTLPLRLERSHDEETDQPVRVVAADTAVHALMRWRRHPTDEAWTEIELTRQGDTLAAALPHQPRAGKLAFQLRLTREGERAVFPAQPAVTRFRGDISAFIVIPHIICMFGGLMLLLRAGLGAVANDDRYPRHALLGVVLFALGGFLFGPWMQHQAFGPWWTGFPLGTDMTDNKTAVAMAAWLFALWRLRGGKAARGAVIAAAAITLAVFLIPHSVFGSQIDWSQAPPAR